MLLPRTVRLDTSDDAIFANAASPGEWAVSGGFMFMNFGQDVLSQAEHNAFACGFLGTDSFGWSTLVSVEPISEPEFAAVLDRLSFRFLTDLGAPTAEAARTVAEQELRAAAALCEHPAGTLLTVVRRFESDEIVERYATITPHHAIRANDVTPIDLSTLAILQDGGLT